jgi:tetratricopeptide (TPR) repeat protein
MPELGPEIPRVEELIGEKEEAEASEGAQKSHYGRNIAIATIVTTLIGALVAFAQAGAVQNHDRADARAETYGTLAGSASAIATGRADIQLQRLNDEYQAASQASTAELFQTYGTGTPTEQQTANSWGALLRQTESDSKAIAASQFLPFICSPVIDPHCPAASALYSPEEDPRFPTRYLQNALHHSYDLGALREGANQAAEGYENQFVHFAACLTMLAVALFLLGYSLTPQGTTRRTLYAKVAGGLVTVASLWALILVLSAVTTPPAAAASAYANGEVALNDGSYHAAIHAFSIAVRKDPDFTDAYSERAAAEFGAGFPMVDTGFTEVPTTAGPATVPSFKTLLAATNDDLTAIDDNSDSATLLYDAGRDWFYRGVLTRNTNALQSSGADLSAAVARIRTEPNASELLASALMLVGADHLALGDSDTQATYGAAFKELQTPRLPREPIVAAALTDLNLITTENPKLTKVADPVETAVVDAGLAGATTPYGDPANSDAHVTIKKISVQPDPGHALYTVGDGGAFNPAKDSLSIQYEYKDPLHGEWAVLPELSGPVGVGGIINFYQGQFDSNNESYVAKSSPATCLPPGQYRLNMYVNGHLAGEQTGPGLWPALHAVRLSDVDAAMCLPAGWKSFTNGPGSDGYLSPDGNSGAIILAIPKAALDGATGQGALASLLTAAVEGLTGSDGFFSGLQSNGKAYSTPFFMSSANGQEEDWSINNGSVTSGVGTSSNGDVYVGVTWSTTKADKTMPKGGGTLAQQLYYSLSPL